MNPIVNFLDCGCAIHANGQRDICPSCASPSVVTTTTHSEYIQVLEARLERAEKLLGHIYRHIFGSEPSEKMDTVDLYTWKDEAQSFLAGAK